MMRLKMMRLKMMSVALGWGTDESVPMKIERTIKRLAAKDATDELRRGARDIGHELNSKRLPVLAELRTSLARMDKEGASDFVLGYREALADLLTAYSASIEPGKGAPEHDDY